MAACISSTVFITPQKEHALKSHSLKRRGEKPQSQPNLMHETAPPPPARMNPAVPQNPSLLALSYHPFTSGLPA